MRRLLLLVLLAALSACKPKEAPAAPDAAAAAVEREHLREGDDTVRPVYPIDKVTVLPIARELCDAIMALPRRREAECCSRPARASSAELCEKTLSSALASGAVKLEAAGVAKCREEMTRALEGCDWVGVGTPPPPAACRGLIEGTLADGKACRSNLECSAGSQCFGLGPTDLGVCGPPGKKLAPCRTSVDTLVTYTGQTDFEDTHPPCAGVCMRTICTEPFPLGGACVLNEHCGPGNRCEKGTCKKGPYLEGYECAGYFCTDSLRCIGGTCRPPQNHGAVCKNPFECRGTCVFDKSGKSGVCQRACATTTASSSPSLR